MVKTVISVISVFIIILSASIFESLYIKNQFTQFNASLNVLYDKIEEESAVEEDVLYVQKKWIEHKRKLCAFIPHTEIKEVELWLSETVTLVKEEEWVDALSKVEVLIELSEQIPKTFVVSLETVF